MITLGIIILLVGALLLVISVLLCFGHIGLLHDYHRDNVDPKHYKKFGILLGLSLLIGALGLFSDGLIAIFCNDSSLSLLIILLAVVPLFIAIILMLLIIRKFNGKIIS